MKYYLGTNFGHNSAAVINSNGKLLFAVEEGRLINKKNTDDFPLNSIKLIKEKYKISESAEGWNIYKRFLIKGVYHSFKYGFRHNFYFQHRFKKELKRFIIALNYYKLRNTKFVGHHLAHAYSLLPYGLKKNSLIFISDTMGETESISCYFWHQDKMILISKSSYPNSIGSLFHQFAYHIGFEGASGPGKLMAYSALGDPIWCEELKKIVKIKNGKFKILRDKFPSHLIKNTWLNYANNFCENENLKSELIQAYKNFKKGKDLSASIQKMFTETAIEIINQNLDLAEKKFGLKIKEVALGGGASLNCQANYHIFNDLKKRNIDSLVISPWSDDSGTSIGAAVWLAKRRNKTLFIKKSDSFLGPHSNSQRITKKDSKNIESAVNILIKGGIIGLCDGRLEFGPRALGGRAIICSANNETIKHRLNKIKGRHDFMPFAPVCFEEDNKIFFDSLSTEAMTIAVPIKKEGVSKVPGAIHENMLARVQLLNDNNKNMLLFKVLSKYKEETGIGVLLLTSLNYKDSAMPFETKKALKISKELKLDGFITDNNWTIFEL